MLRLGIWADADAQVEDAADFVSPPAGGVGCGVDPVPHGGELVNRLVPKGGDPAALRAAPARMVVAAGATSTGHLPNRTAVALAGELGTPVAEFPGAHGGFMAQPEQFGRVLDQVLTQPG